MMRSPLLVQRAVQLLDVERTECFAPRDGYTHCNGYAKVFCACAWDLELPAALANDLHDHLADPESGWRPVDKEAAAQLALLGVPLLASWKNPDGHGHIAPVVGSAGNQLFVSAAGGHCFRLAPIEHSFGLVPYELFTHD